MNPDHIAHWVAFIICIGSPLLVIAGVLFMASTTKKCKHSWRYVGRYEGSDAHYKCEICGATEVHRDTEIP